MPRRRLVRRRREVKYAFGPLLLSTVVTSFTMFAAVVVLAEGAL
jgi:hypothetical protein